MTKKLWGGRFTKGLDPIAEEFTKSIQYDYKLARYDVFGSIAHVTILKKAGVLKVPEASKLLSALRAILKSIESGTFKLDMNAEDIHTNIQNILEKKVGSLALKLQTARSRNDQVALATKMYCKMEIAKLQSDIMMLELAILKCGEKNKKLIMPGFTHMQHAQPVYLKDYLDAYGEMLKKDCYRLNYIFKTLELSFGAGALAGTPIESAKYNISSSEYIKEENFGKSFDIHATVNSLESVSGRDFVIEIISALSILSMHLSRLAEDLIIWSTKEFDFVEIDESFCTGSSLMPQKKNADVLELIRGYAGRIYGNLMSVLTMMKALPLSYNRDMQLDKEPLFNSFEIVSGELKVLTGIMETIEFNEDRIEEYLKDESLYATDLVYYLVGLGIPFKTAHTLIGRLVKYSLENSIPIKDMPEKFLKEKLSSKIKRDEVVKRFDPEFSVKSKRSIKREK